MKTETKSESTKRKINSTKKYEQYILDRIDFDGYDFPSDATITTEGKLNCLAETFKSEYCHEYNLRRYGSYQRIMAEWLAGLPSCINIPFYNHDILKLAKEMGSLPEDATEKQEDRILENYWNFIAQQIFKMFRKFNITVS